MSRIIKIVKIYIGKSISLLILLVIFFNIVFIFDLLKFIFWSILIALQRHLNFFVIDFHALAALILDVKVILIVLVVVIILILFMIIILSLNFILNASVNFITIVFIGSVLELIIFVINIFLVIVTHLSIYDLLSADRSLSNLLVRDF